MGKRDAQLKLIAALLSECAMRGVRIWLFGGWGLDALQGRISREHGDIDIIARESSKARLRAALEQIGGEISGKKTGWLFRQGDLNVDVVFAIACPDGTVVVDVDSDDPNLYPWPLGSFPEEPNGRLPGLLCRVISWDALYVAKAFFGRIFVDITLRPQDEADLQTIRQHVPDERVKWLEQTLHPVPRAAIARAGQTHVPGGRHADTR